jgi:hypothetical protein
MFQMMGTQLNSSTTYHWQFDGKIERVNQVIEDILWMYVIEKSFKMEDTSILRVCI